MISSVRTWSAYTLLLLVSTTVSVGVFVLVTARALGPAGRGQVATFTSVVVIASACVVAFALGPCHYYSAKGIRFTAVIRELNTELVIAVVFALAILVGGVVLSDAAARAGSSRYILGAVALIAMSSATVLQWSLLGLGRFRETALARLAANVGLIAGVVLLAVLDRLTVMTALCAWVASWLVLTCVLAVLIAPHMRRLDSDLPEPPNAYARRSATANVGALLAGRLDLWIVAVLAGPTQAGVYSVSLGLAEVAGLPGQAVAAAVQTHSAHSDGEGTSWRDLHRVVLLATLAATTLVVVVPWLITPIFGEDYRSAIGPFLVLCLAALPLGVQRVAAAYWLGRGRPEHAARAATAMVLAIGLAACALVPVMDAMGGATASLIAYALGAAIACWPIASRRRYGTRASGSR